MKQLGQRGGNRYGLDAKKVENHSAIIFIITDKSLSKISLYNKFKNLVLYF